MGWPDWRLPLAFVTGFRIIGLIEATGVFLPVETPEVPSRSDFLAAKWNHFAGMQYRFAWERNHWAFMGKWLNDIAQRGGRQKAPHPDYINFRGQRAYPLMPKAVLNAGQQKKSKPDMSDFNAAYAVGQQRLNDRGRPPAHSRKNRS